MKRAKRLDPVKRAYRILRGPPSIGFRIGQWLVETKERAEQGDPKAKSTIAELKALFTSPPRP